MVENPLVSIVCTVYNKEPWLKQTIDSFLKQQTQFSIEILLIDDASTDQSLSILREYEAKYPEMIRVFVNEENLGIAKTWIKACQFAKGYYIARCDGDDFWLDPEKLQKQVDLLSSRPDSRWSNTDFDVYDERGQFVSAAGFENGTIALADTFEKMLATRGFTMASTWLVERDLMLEVNELLDVTTSDDTFNLQLELFQRTELAYLPEATVGFVMNQGSDSRPKRFEQIEQRFNKLLAVQNAYLDAYPQSDYREMLGLLLDRSNRFELELTKNTFGFNQVEGEEVTVYFEDANQEFSQSNTFVYPLSISDDIRLVIPEGCQKIRIDLSENPSFYQFVQLESEKTSRQLEPVFTNGIQRGEQFFFPKRDPQIMYSVSEESDGRVLFLRYAVINMNNKDQRQTVLTMVGEAWHEKEAQWQQELQAIRAQAEEYQRQYQTVITSRRWTIPTKLINFFRRK